MNFHYKANDGKKYANSIDRKLRMIYEEPVCHKHISEKGGNMKKVLIILVIVILLLVLILKRGKTEIQTDAPEESNEE